MSVVAVFVYSVLGILVGSAVDRLNGAVQRGLKMRDPLLRLAVSLVLLVAVPFALAPLHSGDVFVHTWQTTLPGLYFAAFFFGTQSTLMANVQAVTGRVSESGQ